METLTSKNIGYWTYDHVRQVPYKTNWTNPAIHPWADAAYGSVEKFTDAMAYTVSVTETDRTLPQHPTGGRVLVHELPFPYIDPQFELPCYEADVKGVLLTTQGHIQEHSWMIEEERAELMWHTRRKEAFGYECTDYSIPDSRKLLQARAQGIYAPIPAAILEPEYFYIKGQKIDLPNIRRVFDLDPEERFCLYVRLWPVSSMRASDYLESFRVPSWELFTTEWQESNLVDLTVARLLLARKKFTQFEYPRMLRSYAQAKTPEELYEAITDRVMINLEHTMELGMSPVSGEHYKRGGASHTSLHNWSTSGAIVEWHPTVTHRHMTTENRFNHIRKVLSDAHAFLTISGVAMLTDFESPTGNIFLERLGDTTHSRYLKHVVYTILGDRRYAKKVFNRQWHPDGLALFANNHHDLLTHGTIDEYDEIMNRIYEHDTYVSAAYAYQGILASRLESTSDA